MVKGEYNYTRPIIETLRFLPYHSLRGKQHITGSGKFEKSRNETVFAQNDDDELIEDDKKPSVQNMGKICGQWRDGTCPYKTKPPERSDQGINLESTLESRLIGTVTASFVPFTNSLLQ